MHVHNFYPNRSEFQLKHRILSGATRYLISKFLPSVKGACKDFVDGTKAIDFSRLCHDTDSELLHSL